MNSTASAPRPESATGRTRGIVLLWVGTIPWRLRRSPVATTASPRQRKQIPPQPPPNLPRRDKKQVGHAALDDSAVRSRLAVLTFGKENEAKQVVILGQPAGVRDIPEFSQPSRPDMLPREMVRQAVLVAARDELGLATRDEVIDENPADSKEGTGGIVEVDFIHPRQPIP